MYIKKFRNIEEANLTFGKKINIISGQNGAGKSNILSLIASASGMPKNAFEVIKNSGINIQPDFYDYFHINSNEDFLNYEVFSTYRSTATDKTITKLLRFKDDTDQGRGIRLIPTVSQIGASNEFAFTSKVAAIKYAKNNFNITYEARIPLATQYLSISRLVPRGESDLKKALITKRSSIKNLKVIITKVGTMKS
jgi:AAA15 family ATPase/GTPase